MTPEAGGNVPDLFRDFVNEMPHFLPEEKEPLDDLLRNRLSQIFFAQHFMEVGTSAEAIRHNAERMATLFPTWKKTTRVSSEDNGRIMEEPEVVSKIAPDFDLTDLVISAQSFFEKSGEILDKTPEGSLAYENASRYIKYWATMRETCIQSIEFDNQIPKKIERGGEE